MGGARSARKRRRAGPAPQPPPIEAAPPVRSRRWRKLAAIGAGVLVAAAAIFALRRPAERWWTARLFARAQQMLASGRDAEALGELETVVRRDPGHHQARLALADLELRRGRVERAFLDLETYTEIAPEDVEGWIRLADLEEGAAQPAEAEAALTQGLRAAPAVAGLHRRRAQLRLRFGRLRAALEDARVAVGRDPRDVEAWIVLCRATASMQGDAAGEAAVRQAIAAAGPDPRLRDLLRGPLPTAAPEPDPRAVAPGRTENWPGDLGVTVRQFIARMRQQDTAGVAEVVRSARERYPGTLLGPWLQGSAALAQKRIDEAEHPLLEALRVAPRSHRVVTSLIGLWSRRHGPEYCGDRLVRLSEDDPGFAYPLPIAAHAYLEAAQPAKAEATVRRLFALLPGSPAPFRENAEFFLAVDRASDAIATAERGLSRFPQDADLELLLARAALSLGDRERAIAAYEQALAARPDDAKAAAQLARLLDTARKDGASRERALRLVRELEFDRPSDPEVLDAIGTVLLDAASDARSAQRWLLAARDAAPDDPSIRYRLALAFSRSGDAAKAREEIGAALRAGRPFAEEAEARRLSSALETARVERR